MKRLFTATIALTVLLHPSVARCDKPIRTEASKVTLFIDGAQVTREKQVELPAGTTTLRFTGLSPYLDAGSLQVAARGRLTVLGVDSRLCVADSLELVKQRQTVERDMKTLTQEHLRTKAGKERILAEIELLKINCSTANRTAQIPLSSLRELTDYYGTQLRTFKEQLQTTEAELERQLARQQDFRRQLNRINERLTEYKSEVVVQVAAETPCRGSFALTYYVRNAGWLPCYDIRSEGLQGPLALSYKARVFQNTKEEWKDVCLTLFSSNPATGNIAPQLRTYWLDYGLAAPRYDILGGTNIVSGTVFDAEENRPLIGASVLVPGTTLGTTTDQNGHYALTLPDGYDRLSFSYIGMEKKTLHVTDERLDVRLKPDRSRLDEVAVTASGRNATKQALNDQFTVSVVTDYVEFAEMEEESDASEPVEVRGSHKQMGYEFAVRRPYSIPSDGKAVAVEIGRYELPVAYSYRCSPKADRDAFLIAEATDYGSYNLLEGEANIYFEQTFVGKSVLNPDSGNDTLRFSLGRDRSIVVRREKESDYTLRRTIGSNRIQSIGWLLSIRNTRREPVTLLLCDQLPLSRNSQIVVTPEELSDGTLDPRNGLVTWQLRLQPGEQRDLRLRYKVKYPKDRRLPIE